VTVVPWDGEQAILTFFSDISQRKQLEEKLRDTLEERETILENSLVGIAFLTHEGGFAGPTRPWPGCSASRTELRRRLTGAPCFRRGRNTFAWTGRHCRSCMGNGRAYQSDLQMRRLDGSLFWVTASGKAVSAAGQDPGQRLGCDGHHPRKELEAALARTSSEREAIFNSALVGISFNVDRRIQWVNDKYEEMTVTRARNWSANRRACSTATTPRSRRTGRDTREALVRDGVYVDERQFCAATANPCGCSWQGRCVRTATRPQA
jgi:PAS domain-containing protein